MCDRLKKTIVKPWPAVQNVWYPNSLFTFFSLDLKREGNDNGIMSLLQT